MFIYQKHGAKVQYLNGDHLDSLTTLSD